MKEAPSRIGLNASIAFLQCRDIDVARYTESQRETVEFSFSQINKAFPLCESPIEKGILPWLVLSDFSPLTSDPVRVYVKGDEEIESAVRLIIVPQMVVGQSRVDFMLIGRIGDKRIKVALECDGGEFHRDRYRDYMRDRRLYLEFGVTTVRATGSEIANNPQHVAETVRRPLVDWAVLNGLEF